MATGVVREWHDADGWGVLDSDETPGGCWAHFSGLRMAGYHRAVAGQEVNFTYERCAQDGFDYRALEVTIKGIQRVEPDVQEPGSGYRSHLSIEVD
jgi:CspA family cold shock protein